MWIEIDTAQLDIIKGQLKKVFLKLGKRQFWEVPYWWPH